MSRRYGSAPLKSQIGEEEFEIIKTEFCNKDDIHLLDSFYELDENNIFRKDYKLKNVKTIMHKLQVHFLKIFSLKFI